MRWGVGWGRVAYAVRPSQGTAKKVKREIKKERKKKKERRGAGAYDTLYYIVASY